jgi:omega-6 fatty acid desaturase (delta-12 desaturase)
MTKQPSFPKQQTDDTPPSRGAAPPKKPDWYPDLVTYGQADRGKATWQLANTVIPYLLLWALMVYLVRRGQGYAYWLLPPLVVVASVLLVRIFIFFHDCCHGSFFPSRRANRIWGYITGILTLTPYEDWRHTHAIHHATAGDLDRRGVGDVWTMTVDEYRTASPGKRFWYRLYRFPLFMFGIGPVYSFAIGHRFPDKSGGKRERRSVLITNLALLAIVVVASLTVGFWTFLLIQLAILTVGGAAGLWLFYVQHQFEDVYWARHEKWDFLRAALGGSSYYKLPKVLQWCTGNIGLHHIHHLRPRIPNYRLQQCYDNIPALQAVHPVTLWESRKSLRMRLWDEAQQRMVGFGAGAYDS